MQDISKEATAHETALRAADNLEAHCLTCRRRRVRCDATRPTCRRCQSDGISCRGYKQQLKIIPFKPNGSSKLAGKRVTREPKDAKWRTQSVLKHSLSHDDDPAIIDAIRSYNGFVARRVSPAHHPFKRQEIPEGVDWHNMPKVLQYLLVLTTRSSQAMRNSIDPMLRHDICHYRSLSLSELKRQLPDAITDFYGLALGCILLIMAADMHPSAKDSWTFHFQAAGRIIELRGGLDICLSTIPNMKTPLLNYMVVDVLTATTCRSALLFVDDASIKAHSDHLSVLTKWENDVVANSLPCPHVILQSIVRTNIIRGSQQAWQTTHVPATDIDGQVFLDDFSKILVVLESFDARKWVLEILQSGRPLPQRAEDYPSFADVSAFTSLTICCKSAAVLYLVLSAAPFFSVSLQEVVRSAQKDLFEHSFLLFEASDRGDEDGPLHTQLWKFLTWPLVISIYTRVGWDIGVESENVTTALNRLENTAATFRLRRLSIAVQHMRKIAMRRSSSARSQWTWDDGFSSRAIFAL